MGGQDTLPDSKGKAGAQHTEKAVDRVGDWFFEECTELSGLPSLSSNLAYDPNSCNAICLPAVASLLL